MYIRIYCIYIQYIHIYYVEFLVKVKYIKVKKSFSLTQKTLLYKLKENCVNNKYFY